MHVWSSLGHRVRALAAWSGGAASHNDSRNPNVHFGGPRHFKHHGRRKKKSEILGGPADGGPAEGVSGARQGIRGRGPGQRIRAGYPAGWSEAGCLGEGSLAKI